jgi:hypothetical protein
MNKTRVFVAILCVVVASAARAAETFSCIEEGGAGFWPLTPQGGPYRPMPFTPKGFTLTLMREGDFNMSSPLKNPDPEKVRLISVTFTSGFKTAFSPCYQPFGGGYFCGGDFESIAFDKTKLTFNRAEMGGRMAHAEQGSIEIAYGRCQKVN